LKEPPLEFGGDFLQHGKGKITQHAPFRFGDNFYHYLVRFHEQMSLDLRLKINDGGFGGQIDQIGSAGQYHVGKEIGLVNLTGLCTRGSDADRNFVFNEIW
jgi:hypothetical protein